VKVFTDTSEDNGTTAEVTENLEYANGSSGDEEMRFPDYAQ
jgi:hypothetical protein